MHLMPSYKKVTDTKPTKAAINTAKFSKSSTKDAPSSTYPIRNAVIDKAKSILIKLTTLDVLETSFSLKKNLTLFSERTLLNHSCTRRTK